MNQQAAPPLRTVCHGCRGVTVITEQLDSDDYLTRTVLVPGDGTITRLVAADNEAGEVAVTLPCPSCGDSENPGWLSGFVPPV